MGLAEHLTNWLGAWPPPSDGSVLVVGSESRNRPGWDGAVRRLAGVSTPTGTVLSVSPDWVESVRRLGTSLDALRAGIPEAVGQPRAVIGMGIFRWSTSPAPHPDAGEWVATDDPRVPAWLRPFNGDVLIAWGDAGAYGGGVGRKQHDQWGHEISVGTEEALRGRGIARRLVAQAARRILDDGAVPSYLHAPDNVASAHVAEACNFPDAGWRVIGMWGPGVTPG